MAAMRELVYTLLGEGATDKRLVHPIDWAIRQIAPDLSFRGQWADHRVIAPTRHGLNARVASAVEEYPCDLLFVHRDADSTDPAPRRAEIDEAATEEPATVPVIPIRMLEAWFLFDESAIRSGAGKPRGRAELNLPSVVEAERMADPKSVLRDSVRAAAEVTGRRLRRFNDSEKADRVAELVTDFSPLRAGVGFPAFEHDLAAVLPGLIERL